MGLHSEQIPLQLEEELYLINKYWNASNYLTVIQMYLKDNFLVEEPLRLNHLKENVPGHWGTSPGINFIYAHVNALICRHSLECMLTIGPGHAACALLANLYMEQTLLEHYPQFTLNTRGLRSLANYFGHPQGFRSEISPHLPGVIYDGGELGYALAVSYGAVLDRPDLVAVCVIGDGEAESGPTAAAWHSNKYLDIRGSGAVLPILHLNGFRMGGPSIWATMTDEELIAYFTGLGYQPIIVNGSHLEMYQALEESYRLILRREQTLSNPMIILKSPKGWTGPAIEGKASAHKIPVQPSPSTVAHLEHWLKSYNPQELFLPDGSLDGDIRRIIPVGQKRMGMSLERFHNDLPELVFPDLRRDVRASSKEVCSRKSKMAIVASYLGEIFDLNKDKANFRVMSPDELISNGLGGILTHTKKGYNRITANAEDTAMDGRIMEILSEHTCHGWLQGYLQSGGSGLLVSYEAFSPIFGSMMTQYAKFLNQSKQLPWRGPVSSMNYLLTSVCWENTYSHQNPEFINMAVSKSFSFIRCYFPYDANTLLMCLDDCLRSHNRINVIVAAKRELPQWSNREEAVANVSRGIACLSEVNDASLPDLVMVSVGDYPAEECTASIQELSTLVPHIRIRCLAVLDITILGEPSVYPHALTEGQFAEYFPRNVPVLFNFHGYPSAIKALLFDRIRGSDFSVVGYGDKSSSSAPVLYKMMQNGTSRHQLSIMALERLVRSGKVSQEEFAKCNEILLKRMESYLERFTAI